MNRAEFLETLGDTAAMLRAAADIYGAVGLGAQADNCRRQAEKLDRIGDAAAAIPSYVVALLTARVRP